MQRRGRITRRGIAAVACALIVAPVLVASSPTAAGTGPAPRGTVEQIGRDIADANTPSISADGRWIVFGGTLGERRSVFRTDRATETTIELSPVPKGIESGDTIHARLSADGCIVAAVTEIPFDLFRDDDRDERWDVYRLVLPECGGQPTAWELVSVDERTGVAVDGVFVDSPPAALIQALDELFAGGAGS